MDITVVQETAEYIWLTYTEPPGCIGYVFYVNGVRVSNTWNPSPPAQPIKFHKPHSSGDVFEVQALGSIDIAQVTGGGVQPVPPPPVTGKVRGMYAAGNQTLAWPDIKAIGCNLLVTGYDTPLLNKIKSDGCKAWVTCGYWDDNKGAFSLSDAQAVQVAKAAFATGAVHSFYIADEPSKSPNLIKARSDLLKAACPGVTTVMTTWDPGIVSQFAHSTDYIALDGYPNRGGFSKSVIPAQAAAADKAKWPYFGVIGSFGSSAKNAVYALPTPAQLQSMIDQWNATNQLGYVFYCWGPEVSVNNPDDYIENNKDLIAVMETANSK